MHDVDPTPPADREILQQRWLRWWAPVLLVSALFLMLQPFIGSGWALFSDSYRYAKQAEQILGATVEESHLSAVEAYCDARSHHFVWEGAWIERDETRAQWQLRMDACMEKYVPMGDVTTLDPRYQSIFTSRPGYPLVAAPFIATFGILTGMRILGFAMALGGGILSYTVLRQLRLRPLAAASGQAIFLISPLGWWALQALSEGLVTILTLTALAGLLLLRERRTTAGMALMALSWLALGIVRFSSLLLIAAALTVTCLLLARWGRADHRRAMLRAAGVSGAAAVGVLVAMPLLGLPGADVTLQDTFTRHYVDPLVPNPWYRLAALNYHFWPTWLTTPSASLLVLSCSLVGLAALWRWHREMFWMGLALWAVGVAHVAAHPLPQEAERLGLFMWLPAVLGLPFLVQTLTRRLRVTTTITLRQAPAAVATTGPGAD